MIRTVYDLDSKYIYNSEAADEFYDLLDDPLELKNLIDEPSDEMDRLKRALASYRRRFEQSSVQSRAVSQEVQDELKSLGYIN